MPHSKQGKPKRQPSARLQISRSGDRHTRQLHGPRRVRYWKGRGYPYVHGGSTYLRVVTKEYSKKEKDQHEHFSDPVFELHEGDFDLDVFKGLDLRRMHKTQKYGNIGQCDGARITEDRELFVWGQIFGDTDEGYDAIVELDHGRLGGMSIKFQNYLKDGQLMMGKAVEEMSLTKTGKAHYDNCLVTISCSKNEATSEESYSTATSGKTGNNNNTVPQQAPPVAQNPAPQTQDAGSTPNMNDPKALAALLQDLQSQVQKANQEKQAVQDALLATKKEASELSKKNKVYEDKEKKALEERNAKILADLPGTLEVLGSVAGLKSVNELSPKAVKFFEAAWTDPENEQFMKMTKMAAQRIKAYEEKEKMWDAQRKQLGVAVGNSTVSVAAAKARQMIDDAKREQMRQEKGLTFDQVYEDKKPEADNPVGAHYNGLFSQPNLGNWGTGAPSQQAYNNAMSLNSGAPIVQQPVNTQAVPFGASSGSMNTVPVAASQPKVQRGTPMGGYTEHQTGGFKASVGRYGWGQEILNGARGMSLRDAKAMLPISIRKGDALQHKGDVFA